MHLLQDARRINSQDASTVPTSSRPKLGLVYANVGHYVPRLWSSTNELPSPTRSPLQKSSLQSAWLARASRPSEPTDKLTWLTGLDGRFILTRRPATCLTDVRVQPTRSCWKPTAEGPPTYTGHEVHLTCALRMVTGSLLERRAQSRLIASSYGT